MNARDNAGATPLDALIPFTFDEHDKIESLLGQRGAIAQTEYRIFIL